ncbi:MAG: hypothetical protein WCA95_05165 [Opitutaceae bacterium]
MSELGSPEGDALNAALSSRFISDTHGAGLAEQVEITRGADDNGLSIYSVKEGLIQMGAQPDDSPVSVATFSYTFRPGLASIFGLRAEYLPK